MGETTTKEVTEPDPNRDTKDKICEYLAEGLWFKDACALAGISKETGHRWKREDDTFNTRVKTSILEYKRTLIKTVNFNTVKSWKAGVQVLKTRWPKEWNITKKIEHGGEIKHTVTARKEEIKEFAESLLTLSDSGGGRKQGGNSLKKNLRGLQGKSRKSKKRTS